MNEKSIWFGLALLMLASVAWSKDPEPTSQELIQERGKAVYVTNCVACHNREPARDGPVGPALKGSSRELLEYRVLRREYPPGYAPKRKTNVMPAFPFLKSELSSLAAYLR